MGKIKPRDVSRLKPKKKCCRSKKRCLKCPFVVHKMQKAVAAGESKKELEHTLKRIRAA